MSRGVQLASLGEMGTIVERDEDEEHLEGEGPTGRYRWGHAYHPHGHCFTPRARVVVVCAVVTFAALIVFVVALQASRGGGANAACEGTSSPGTARSTLRPSDSGVKPRSIVFFISDGMGPGYVTAARDAQLCGGGDDASGGEGEGLEGELELEKHLVGLCRTRSANSLVTDSAAGATAYATGYKTDNHVVSKVPVHDVTGEGGGVGYGGGGGGEGTAQPTKYRSVGTIIEGAQLAGKLTGIVTTTRVTHATPAAFSAHVTDRNDENEIAREQIYSLDLNVLMGGGRRHFDKKSTPGSKRADDVDLVATAKMRGYEVATDAASMRRAAASVRDPNASSLPPSMRAIVGPRMLGLFAPSHLPYEIDLHGGFDARVDAHEATQVPSLDEMTSSALEVLSTGDNGFFLLVEAGRIDHAGHAHDASAALAEVCAYDRAFKAAIDFAASRPDVLVVATSDHDTGGLSVGCCGQYALNVSAIKQLRASAEVVTERVAAGYAAAVDPAAQGLDILVRSLAAAGRSVSASVAADAADALAAGVNGNGGDVVSGEVCVEDLLALHALALALRAAGAAGSHGYEGYDLQNKVGEVLNKPNLVGFTSNGHTGVDVPLFAYGASSSRFAGYMENTEVGKEMINLLGVDPEMGYDTFLSRISTLENTVPAAG